MGNQLAAPARVQPGELLATDVPNLVFKDSLGGGRFLKTFLTRHEEGQRGGLVVVKVYLKRGAPGTGGGLDPALVKEHERRLRRLRNALSSPAPTHLHAWPFQRELETDRAVYLMRQYAHSTLYDRVSTRPFLSHVEKKWMAYQLLHGLADCHERGIAHGDVKLENVLVTSWGWAFLTDFATFKPETLPADNPADYSFFFDTGGRRRCYVAPERFRDGAQGSPGDRRGAEASAASAAGPAGSAGAPDASADPARDRSGADVRHGVFEETHSYDFAAADVFSLGCALGELFLDGSALFDLSQLLAYRRGEHDPSQQLQAVADRDARALVMAMLHRDPARRPTARAHLERWKSGGREPLGARADSETEPFFPAYFETMHDFCASLMMKDADQTAEAVRAAFEPLLADIAREEGGVRERGRAPSPPGASPASARPEASGDAAPATSGGGASPATEHMMRDIDAMMADIGNLLGDASDDAEKVSGNGDEMNGVTGGGASFEWFDRDGEPASDGEPTDSGGSISATAPAIRAATPEDAALIAETVARGASLPGAVLVASVVCSCVRGAVRPSLRRDALGLLSRVAAVADDDARLQLIVPFCVASAADGAAAVRAAAVRALAETTRRVETFPASDAKVFPEFVWPSLSGLARDREESVRVAYAASLASLARASARFLQRANEGSEDAADGLSMSAYEDDLASLRALVRGAVLDYLTPGGSGGGGGRAETSSGGGDVAAGGVFPSPAFVRGAADASRAAAAAGGVADPDQSTAARVRAGGGPGADADERASDPSAAAAAEGSRLSRVGAGVGAFARPPATPPPGLARHAEDPSFAELTPASTSGAFGAPSPSTLGGAGAAVGRHPRDAGPPTRAAVLAGADALASFFGRADANDFLVPLLITCLNDRSWRLRVAFFERIAAVARFVGVASAEAFLLPCVERCLADDSDEVAAAALRCLGDMCGADVDEARAGASTRGLSRSSSLETSETSSDPPFDPSVSSDVAQTHGATLRKRSVLAAAKRAAPALCHPAGAVRAEARRFFEAASKRLGAADAFALLLPLARPFLAARFASLGAAAADVLADRSALAAATRAPPSREAFEDAVVAAGGAPRRRRRRASRSFDAGSSVDWTEGGGDALAFDKEVGASKNARENENDTSVDAATLATLDAMDAYVRAAAAARRGAERDASSARSLVAGGLTPAAVAAKRADAAAAAAAAERERQSSAAYIARGGLFGNPKAFGAFGAEREKEKKAGGEKEKPLPGFRTTPQASGAADFLRLGARGTDRVLIDDDAWADAFGGRAPPLVPPHAPLVPLREATSSGASAADLARAHSGAGSRRRSLEAPEIFGTRDGNEAVPRAVPASRSGAGRAAEGRARGAHERPPETVTDAFSAAMAKGLDLVSGKNAAADAARDANGGGGDVRSAPTGVFTEAIHRFDGGVTGSESVGLASDRTPRALYASGAPGDAWAPRGVLVAHLREHRRAVRALAASADGLFFVSGGDDGECKLWDRGRLERDVSFRSRLTYASQGGKVTALLAGAGGDPHAVASASDDGSVRVWRVEYVERKRTNGDGNDRDRRDGSRNAPPAVERYTGAAETRQICQSEGAVSALTRVSPSTLCFATRRGGFHGWDLRAPPNKEAFRAPLPPRLGAVTCAAAGGHGFAPDDDGSAAFGAEGDARWVAFGTAAGVLGLLDVRFGVVAAAWQHPLGSATPVDAVAVAAGGRAAGARPLVWAAAGEDEIALWDVAAGTCRRALKVGRARRARDAMDAVDDAEFAGDVAALSVGGRLAPAPRASATSDWAPNDEGTGTGTPSSSFASGESVYRADELRDAPPGVEGARCVLALPSGAVLSGGSDACVRLWCPEDASRSRVVAGPLAPHDRPRYEERRVPVARVPDSSLVPVLRETPPALSARHALRGRLAGSLADGTGDGVKDTVSVAETVASAAARHDCHRDAVLAMCVAGTGAARALVTCGRDAAVKVWK